jgi:hypothetical protein
MLVWETDPNPHRGHRSPLPLGHTRRAPGSPPVARFPMRAARSPCTHDWQEIADLGFNGGVGFQPADPPDGGTTVFETVPNRPQCRITAGASVPGEYRGGLNPSRRVSGTHPQRRDCAARMGIQHSGRHACTDAASVAVTRRRNSATIAACDSRADPRTRRRRVEPRRTGAAAVRPSRTAVGSGPPSRHRRLSSALAICRRVDRAEILGGRCRRRTSR